jgi:hypothetical protein
VSAPNRLLRCAALLGLVALLCVPGALAATTTKTTPTKTAPVGATGKNCWSALIKDWYDGRIDDTYPIHCYKDALKNLPRDVATYSDAYDVISRALTAATRGKKNVNPDAMIAPPAEQDADNGSTTTTTASGSGPDSGGGFGGGNGSSSPPLGHLPGDRGADGVPVPLLILGGLALLLVAAGAAGLIARRVQARRGGPGTV